MSIYVGNLPFEVNQDDVVEVFKEYGEIKRVHLPMDRETGKNAGSLSWKWKPQRKKRRLLPLLTALNGWGEN